MNPTFTFLPDDMMNPVYCKQCRVHIPLAVSIQGNGICPDCVQAKQQAQTAAIQQQQAIQAQRAAAKQAAQQQAAAVQAKVHSLLPYFALTLVVIGLFVGILTYYHNNVVKPLKQDLAQTRQELAQTRSELSDTKHQLTTTQQELKATQRTSEAIGENQAELTDVVNHNARAANHNNGAWP